MNNIFAYRTLCYLIEIHTRLLILAKKCPNLEPTIQHFSNVFQKIHLPEISIVLECANKFHLLYGKLF